MWCDKAVYLALGIASGRHAGLWIETTGEVQASHQKVWRPLFNSSQTRHPLEQRRNSKGLYQESHGIIHCNVGIRQRAGSP
jgi:hypothetical protein